MELQTRSFLSPYGYQAGSCGYCKGDETSGSYYARTSRLTVDHYQDLVDRGWRRSGDTLYKPDLQRSCCPHYTIRLPVSQLKPTRHQRKTLHAWNRHVLGADFAASAAKLRPPRTREAKRAARDAEFDLVAAVHEAETALLPDPSPAPAHRYELTLEPDGFSEEKYALFEQYQRLIHHEPPSAISRRGFRSFLCGSPLERTTRTIDSVAQQLGSFHQLHRLDGRLVALSVLDLLPHGVSAVYFIYLATPTADGTALAAFSPGKLSALREAALARERALQHYYMGFYIHGCAKMRYKAEFRPQSVLDPAAPGRWDPFDGPDGVGAALDSAPFVSMSRRADDGGADARPVRWPRPADAAREAASLFELDVAGVLTVEQLRAQVELDAVPAQLTSKAQTVVVPLAMLQAWSEGSEEDGGSLKGAVAELAAAVGPTVAREMVVKFG